MSELVTSPESLENVPVFAGLSESERRQLIAVGRQKTFSAGETILEQGETSAELWVLLEGKCEVLRKPATGRSGRSPVALAVLEPFASFGEMSFFHPAPHSARVVAKTQARLLCIRRNGVEELASGQSAVVVKLAMNIIAGLADRIRRMDDQLVDLLDQSSIAKKIPELMQLREKMLDGWML